MLHSVTLGFRLWRDGENLRSRRQGRLIVFPVARGLLLSSGGPGAVRDEPGITNLKKVYVIIFLGIIGCLL
jgi:hypothetical protein